MRSSSRSPSSFLFASTGAESILDGSILELRDMQPDLNRLHRDLATAVILFHETIARRLGMTPAERKCAGILAELGSATPGQLITATGLTSGAITGIVDRLV